MKEKRYRRSPQSQSSRTANREQKSHREEKQFCESIRPLFRRFLVIGFFIFLVLATLWFLGSPAYFTNHLASKAVSRLDAFAAEYWLGWSNSFAPDHADTRLIQARIARRRGDLAEMEEHLRVARRTANREGRVTRERMLAEAQQGKLTAIEPQLNQWLFEQNPDAAEICDAYVNGLFVASRLEMAERVLDAWQSDFPQDPRPYYRRGRLYQHFDRLADAEGAFRNAITLKPDYYSALYNLGRVLNEQKRSTDAIPIYEACMQMPNPLAVRVAKAQALVATGKTDAAEELLRDVLRADVKEIIDSYRSVDDTPELFTAASELGNLLLNAGIYDEAFDLLQTALDFNSRDTNARYSRAMALRGLGKIDESEQELQVVQAAREKLAKVNQLRNLINRDPNNTEARLELGELLFRYESQRNGLFWLRSVFSYDPDCQRTKDKIAELMAQTLDNGSPINATTTGSGPPSGK